jgi:hypothetical protein
MIFLFSLTFSTVSVGYLPQKTFRVYSFISYILSAADGNVSSFIAGESSDRQSKKTHVLGTNPKAAFNTGMR